MPRPNNRSYNSNNDNSSRGGYGKRDERGSRKSFKSNKDARAAKFGNDRFNMLNFGQAFLDETPNAKYTFKARVLLKTKDGELTDVVDGDGKGDNVYSPEESAMLIAKALLEGRAINICFFEQEDGWSGNARIDIKDLETDEDDEDEEQAPPPKKAKPAAKAKSSTKAKPKFEIPEEADDDDEEEAVVEETDDDEMPY